jgi:tetratricopeptide (TPR) repeat protein
MSTPGKFGSWNSERLRALAVAAVLLVWPAYYLTGYYLFPDRTQASTQEPRVAKTAPTNPMSESTAVRIDQALHLIQANQPGKAIPLLEEVVASDPRNAIAWNDLCAANTMLMSYNIAILACGKALAIQPDFQLARNNLAWAQGEVRKTQRILANQEQAAPAKRDSAFYLDEGLNFLHVGDYAQAIAAWRRVPSRDAQGALAANNIGTACMFQHDPQQALDWFRKALQLNPTLTLAQNNIAWATDEIAKQQQTPAPRKPETK